MSVYRKGIKRLSQLTIDADKNWAAKGISNIKEVVSGMTKGDLAVRGNTVLARITPGPSGYILTSVGALQIPVWLPGPELEKWFLATLFLDYVIANNPTPDEVATGSLPLGTVQTEAYLDNPTDKIKRIDGSIVLGHAEVNNPTPDETATSAPAFGRLISLKLCVDGAVADDGGSQTDQTAAARNDTTGDMTLLPTTPAQEDAYYFGHDKEFHTLWLLISQQGDGVWTITWEYWNGSTWAALSGVDDNTNGLTATVGLRYCSFTVPGDWADQTVQSLTMRWIRARVSAYTSKIDNPLGTRAWVTWDN